MGASKPASISMKPGERRPNLHGCGLELTSSPGLVEQLASYFYLKPSL